MTPTRFWLPVGLCILGLLAPLAGSAQGNELSVGQVSASPGQEVAVALRLQANPDSLAALDPVLAFDDQQLEVVDGPGDCDVVDPGADLGAHGVYCDFSSGSARIVFDPPASLPIEPLATGEIGILRLRVLESVAIGTTIPIEFTYLNAADSSGNVLDAGAFTLQDGSVTVKLATTTEITAITPSTQQEYGVPYEVSVEVAGDSPTGQVVVSDGAGGTCTIDLPDNACSLSTETIGAIEITAAYEGSSTHVASEDKQGYSIVQRATTVDVASIVPAGSQTAGSPYQVAAQVSPAGATGSIVVDDGTGNACTIVLPDSQCELTSFQNTVAQLSLEYSGDAVHEGSSASVPYQIVAGPPDRLGFDQQPADVAVGAPFADIVAVSLRDQYDNIVASDNSSQVALSLITGGGSAALVGPAEVTVENGVAEFPSLAVDAPGEGFRLEASADAIGLDAELSAPFDVIPAYILFRDRFEP